MAAPAKKVLIRPKRKYSAEDRANSLAVLQSNNGNVLKTARETGIPRDTLREWDKNRRGVTPEVMAIQQLKAGSLAEKFERVAHLAADLLSESETIAKASPLDLAKIGGICVDKSQLLSGQPTSITSAILSEDDRRLRLAELLTTIAARQQTEPQQTQS